MEMPRFWKRADKPVEKPKGELSPEVKAAAKEGGLRVNSLAPDALSNVPTEIGKAGNKEPLPSRPDTVPPGIEDMTDPSNPIDSVFKK